MRCFTNGLESAATIVDSGSTTSALPAALLESAHPRPHVPAAPKVFLTRAGRVQEIRVLPERPVGQALRRAI